MILWISRIGGTRIDTEHPFHATDETPHDTPYGTSDDGADGSGSLIAD
jgi:hypothetical protein